MKPRRAFLIGLTFLIVAAIYYLAQASTGHVDVAGLTILIALSVAMSLMFYVLMAGSGDR